VLFKTKDEHFSALYIYCSPDCIEEQEFMVFYMKKVYVNTFFEVKNVARIKIFYNFPIWVYGHGNVEYEIKNQISIKAVETEDIADDERELTFETPSAKEKSGFKDIKVLLNTNFTQIDF
jgi:hypothetical protein